MKNALLCLLVLMLGACAWMGGENGPFRDRSNDYLDAEVGADVTGLPESMVRERFPVPDAENRVYAREGEFDVPSPPQVIDVEAQSSEQSLESVMPKGNDVVLSQDGNGYPVLMMDMSFDWAWSLTETAIKDAGLLQEDLDRELAVFFVRASQDDEQVYQLKLSYTVNGILVGLQDDKDVLAPLDVAAEVMQKLKSAMR